MFWHCCYNSFFFFFSSIVNNFKQWVPHNRTGEVLIPVLTCFCLFVCLFFSVSPFFHSRSITLNASWPQATRGSGGPHIKVTEMLVVSLRGVNCRFWSHSAWLTLISLRCLILIFRLACSVPCDLYKGAPPLSLLQVTPHELILSSYNWYL